MPEELKRTAESKPEYAPPDVVPLGRLSSSEGFQQQEGCATGASNLTNYCVDGGLNRGTLACLTGGLNTGSGCTVGTTAP